MAKVIAVLGDGGSGKTRLINELVIRHPSNFKKIVTCTSRPVRSSEREGEDYHFHPESYFVSNPSLVLTKKTDVGHYYGTRADDLDAKGNQHLLITLRIFGLHRLIELNLPRVIAINISIDHELKVARMRSRGDSEAAIEDRIRLDAEDRANVDWRGVTIIHLDASDELKTKVKKVLEAC